MAKHMGYVARKLDETNLDEVLARLRKSVRAGKFDQYPSEVTYRQWVTSLEDFEQFELERSRIYREYDDYCNHIVPILETSERLTPRLKLTNLGHHFIALFSLDGKRRGLGAAYNDPDSIGWKYEQRFKNFVSEVVSDEETSSFVTREIIVNILSPELPFDVQMNRDMLIIISILDLQESDFNLNRLIDIVARNAEILQEAIDNYACGSKVTFARKLMKYQDLFIERKTYLQRIEQQERISLKNKNEALDILTNNAKDHGRQAELVYLIEILTKIARYNAIEDIKRRVCMDRFEEYLLRQFICESLFDIGLIPSSDLFEYNQHELVEIVRSYLNSEGDLNAKNP